MLRTITVITHNNRTELAAYDGEVLADVLARNGFSVPAACGRRGTCGKCKVKLLSGSFGEENADAYGMIRSCRATVCDNATVEVEFSDGKGVTDFRVTQNLNSGNGIAVDIGTTTVAAAIKRPDGKVASVSHLNPQSVYGADVLSRIGACSDGALDDLTRLIQHCVRDIITELDPAGEAKELVVSGNATMLHLFRGISPESMGHAPFTPSFTDSVTLSGSELNLPVLNVTLLPSVSAFIGSDIVAGIYATGLHKTDRTILMADLGTNGELVLAHNGKLYCTSTAAGPALEGADIECGAGGISGAINNVFDEDGDIGYTTVGGAKPIGICGAGLADAVTVLLERDMIDRGGYFSAEKLYICNNVYISQNDIRQFQLAKSAIRSGIEILLRYAGASLDDLDEIIISGGLGCCLDPESVFRTGLFPRIDREKVKAGGNTSLGGALMCLGDKAALGEMRNIPQKCKLIDLGGNPDFSELFTANMSFDEQALS